MNGEVERISVISKIEIVPESHFHVFARTKTSNSAVNISRTGCGDEVVALPRLELHLHGGGGEGPEGDGEVHKILWLITDCDDSWFRICDSASVELVLIDAVDDVLLGGVPPGGADDVDLVVLPGMVVLVHLDHRVGTTEYGVGNIPIHINRLDTPHPP